MLPCAERCHQHPFSSIPCSPRHLRRSGLTVCTAHMHANREPSGGSTGELSASRRRDALLAIGAALSSLALPGSAQSQVEAQTGGKVGGTGEVTSASSSFPEVHPLHLLSMTCHQPGLPRTTPKCPLDACMSLRLSGSLLVLGCAASTLLLQEFKSLTDGFLAYTFKYPATISGQPANIIFSRKPERYSSAAPLTPDARQRIVAELVSFPNGVTISVSVRPATAPSLPLRCIQQLCAPLCITAGTSSQRTEHVSSRLQDADIALNWRCRWDRPPLY